MRLPVRVRYIAETGSLFVRVLWQLPAAEWTLEIQHRDPSDDRTWRSHWSAGVSVGDTVLAVGPLERERRCLVSAHGLPTVAFPL